MLQALKAKPWQTRGELMGYEHNTAILQRLEARGLIQRRLSERKHQPYEYALAGEPNPNPPRERLPPREPVPCVAPAKCMCGNCRPWCRRRRKKLDR